MNWGTTVDSLHVHDINRPAPPPISEACSSAKIRGLTRRNSRPEMSLEKLYDRANGKGVSFEQFRRRAPKMRVAVHCVRCPNWNCSGFVILTREGLEFVQLEGWDVHLNLICPLCTAQFQARAIDIIECRTSCGWTQERSPQPVNCSRTALWR